MKKKLLTSEDVDVMDFFFFIVVMKRNGINLILYCIRFLFLLLSVYPVIL